MVPGTCVSKTPRRRPATAAAGGGVGAPLAGVPPAPGAPRRGGSSRRRCGPRFLPRRDRLHRGGRQAVVLPLDLGPIAAADPAGLSRRGRRHHPVVPRRAECRAGGPVLPEQAAGDPRRPLAERPGSHRQAYPEWAMPSDESGASVIPAASRTSVAAGSPGPAGTMACPASARFARNRWVVAGSRRRPPPACSGPADRPAPGLPRRSRRQRKGTRRRIPAHRFPAPPPPPPPPPPPAAGSSAAGGPREGDTPKGEVARRTGSSN